MTILAAVAEMGPDLLEERMLGSSARAKNKGKALSGPSKTIVEQRAHIIAKHAVGESVSYLARIYDVSRANIFGVVNPG